MSEKKHAASKPAPRDTIHHDDLLSDIQLHGVTGLTPSFWRARRLRGDGPVFIKISARCVRYRWSSVLDWFEERERSTTGKEGFSK